MCAPFQGFNSITNPVAVKASPLSNIEPTVTPIYGAVGRDSSVVKKY